MKPSAPVARTPLTSLAAAFLVFAACALAAGPARAQEKTAFNPWQPGRQWMSVRAGFAKSTEDSSGHGAGGYGMSYARMLSGVRLYKWKLFQKYALGASVQHDLIGRFGAAAEVDVEATLELVRHYAWSPNVHPYLGFGVGPYVRKTYRTGNDLRDVSVGWVFTTGVNTPISDHHLLGFDVRMSRIDGKNEPPNPVFGLGSVNEKSSATGTVFEERPVTHWSFKVNYAFAY